MRVLELGSLVIPAYAGMLLAEQGHQVEKWISGRTPDPIRDLHRGDELWAWINHGKTVVERHFFAAPMEIRKGRFDVVIDNIRPSTLEKNGIDPAELAKKYGVRWVSVRSEVGEFSMDAVAQARAWLDFAPWMPCYIGDTSAGLFLAFKAVSGSEPGHFVLGQASCLRKLVEGDLVVVEPRGRDQVPWAKKPYQAGPDGATVMHRGELHHEPARDDAWRLQHLFHEGGRIRI